MIDRIFLSHPQSVGETYFQHARVAGGFAISLFLTSLAAAAHAIFPCLFEKTASRRIAALNERLERRS